MSTETTMAAAFKRALEARKIDIKEAPKLREVDAVEIFREVRWADTDGRPFCPTCKAEKPYVLGSRIGWFRCRNRDCLLAFSMRHKTAFASGKIGFQRSVVVLAASVDEGMNATMLGDVLGVTYKSALRFAHAFGLRDGRRSNLPDSFGSYNFLAAAASSAAPGADLLTEIVRLLPSGIPPIMREDVSQEMALAVICGDIARSEIRARLPQYLADYNRQWRGNYADLSFDQLLPGFNKPTTLGEMLPGDRSFEYWERR